MRHLRALCAIADTGSLRKAARQLGMTQPSLTTQLRRIENTIGGRLFSREVTGSRPTPLGRSVLCRARSIVAEMNALVDEVRLEAGQTADARLRIGSTGSRAVVGWLRRLRARYPDADTTIHIDVSANALLQMVAANQLDVAFVHEVEGAPLRVPEGVERRVLVEREPQFVALAETHPAAARPVVRLAELAADQWMVDPSVDGEGPGLRRVLAAAGLNPRVVYGDYLTAADLVASGEVVTPCQPTARSRQGVAVRPLHGDPLTVRLFLASRAVPAARTGADRAPDPAARTGATEPAPDPAARTGATEPAPDTVARTGATEPAPDPVSGMPIDVDAAAPGAPLDVDALFGDLADAYFEIAWASVVYRQWLVRNESPLLRLQEPPTRDELDILGLAGPAEVS
ncbi:LysR substrate-binding domain-containing protein [Streptomyces sp. MK37H]|uniref:LysR substrate-binding domain-containing protein n=1 Tax=Streptomyces sp. MK37H TaxID=2699117 RepID=UPI001B392C6B|nr:LysR substrate-binding domain-containing protein [Streptomyces sp. MK37H]MBP8536073.1 LysR family transcriptional regulator [Streptomyces sp. MK37H]